MNKKSIKILVAYHKVDTIFKNEFILPIHVGREVAMEESKDGHISNEDYNWLLNNMIGDNTGDNISYKNREYSELTAIYWIWKNYDKIGNPDYISFMHYRRFLILNEYEYDNYNQTMEEKAYRNIHTGNLDENGLLKYGFDYNTILDYINNYDLLLPYRSELKLVNIENSREDYKNTIEGLQVKDYDIMTDLICELYPDYKEYIYQQHNTSRRYFYNVFIMKKEIFFDYCKFLFSITEELYKKIDVSNYNINAKRTIAYLGEALFDCYMRKLINKGNIRYKELGVLKILDPNIIEKNYKSIINDKKIILGYWNTNKYLYIYLFFIRFTIKKQKNIS